MIIKEEYLVKYNNKNKIQVYLIQLDKHPLTDIYTIYRSCFQYGGKRHDAPLVFIERGYQGRTREKEAGLLVNKYIKRHLDEGYRPLSKLTSKKFSALTEEEIKKLLSTKDPSEGNGLPRPMRAKNYEMCSSKVFEKDCYCSPKIEGVRCLIYYRHGHVYSASKLGQTFDPAIKHIVNDAGLKAFFTQFPDIILDGVLYYHGWPINKISELCRSKETTEESHKLQYWVYDYVSKEPFSKREENLRAFKEILSIVKQLVFVEHVRTSGWLKVKKLHDAYINSGFGGVMIRFPERPYGIGIMSANYMIEMKEYEDDVFTIISLKEGFRPEDANFLVRAYNRSEFTVKILGEPDVIEDIIKHKDQYIGKKAICRFLFYSGTIPYKPIFKAVLEDGN